MPAYVTDPRRYTHLYKGVCMCYPITVSMSTPLFTVALPVYNAAEHLVPCIESILVACSSHTARILCCDDCSTDASPDILAHYAKKYSQITVLHNASNRGIAYTRNTLLDHTDTKYHAFCDADDIMHPERFTYQVPFLEAHKDIDVLGTWIRVFDHNLKTASHYNVQYQTDDHAIKSRILIATALCNPAIMLRTAAIRRTHVRHNEGIAVASDHDFSVQLAPFVCFANIPKVLHYYRTHAEQVSTKYFNNQTDTSLEIAQQHLARFKVHIPLEIIRIFREWHNIPPNTVAMSQQKDLTKSILDISAIGNFYGYDGVSPTLKKHLTHVGILFLPTAAMRTHTWSFTTKKERIKFCIKRCAEALYGVRVTHNIVLRIKKITILLLLYTHTMRIFRIYRRMVK